MNIGNKALTQEQTENFWIPDRKALIECRRRHAALRDFYADRDSRLEGKK